MDIDRLVRNCDRVLSELAEITVDVIEDNKKDVIDIQIEQFEEGFRGDGKRTKKYTSEQYIRSKNKKSAKSFPYRNYKDTGDFHQGVFLFAQNDEAVLGSLDEKAPKLEDMENDKLFGIMPKNKPRVSGIISKELIKRVYNGIFR